MKYLALALIPLAAAGAFAAERDRGPGLPGTRQGNALVYAVRDFDGVSLGGAAQVIVHTGPAFSVRAEGPADALANVRIVRTGRTLEVGRRYDGRDTPQDGRVTVHVTMPALTAASVGGSGTIDADRGSGDRFDGAVGGSGVLRIARLEARDARLSLGGSGEIAAQGDVGALEVSIGGSGQLSAPRLRARSATVSLGGSGSVRLDVQGRAKVSMAGSGTIDRGPRAQCTVSKVGSGKVRCGD